MVHGKAVRGVVWGLFLALSLSLTLMIGCGGDDEDKPEAKGVKVKKEVKAPAETDPAARAKKLAVDVQKAKEAISSITDGSESEKAEAAEKEQGPVIEDVGTLLRIWEEEGKKFVFDPVSRKDPFMPIIQEEKEAKIKASTGRPLTPLMKVALSSISLVAVIVYGDEARALVEDSTGTGYIIEKGTFIGRNDGQVVGIHPAVIRFQDGIKEIIKPARIQVEEKYQTYFDQKPKTRIIEILLKGEEQ